MRLVVDTIQYMLGTGCQWRQIPKDFPTFTTVQYHFYKWRDLGIIEEMLDILRMLARVMAGHEITSSAGANDSKTVKTSETGVPSGYGAGKMIKDLLSGGGGDQSVTAGDNKLFLEAALWRVWKSGDHRDPSGAQARYCQCSAAY